MNNDSSNPTEPTARPPQAERKLETQPATRPETMRSPVRPTQTPDSHKADTRPLNDAPKPMTAPTPSPGREQIAKDPAAALNFLRGKMEVVADEFAHGKMNRTQFNAIYKRYSEQRVIIEKLLERDPQSEAWQKVVAVKGQTSFLRQQFEAQAYYYGAFRQDSSEPILTGGKYTPDLALMGGIVRKLWELPNRPKPGLARKQLPNTQWLILAAGDHAATLVIYSLEPSNAQARLIRDLHADFERANQAALARGWLIAERMVFPQRALFEGTL